MKRREQHAYISEDEIRDAKEETDLRRALEEVDRLIVMASRADEEDEIGAKKYLYLARARQAIKTIRERRGRG